MIGLPKPTQLMSNLSFRPRPIDVNRAIPIFTDADAEELDDRDYGSVSGLSRSVPQMPTGMEAEEEEVRWYCLCRVAYFRSCHADTSRS